MVSLPEGLEYRPLEDLFAALATGDDEAIGMRFVSKDDENKVYKHLDRLCVRNDKPTARMYVFGGKAKNTCLNDLHLLNTCACCLL